MTRYDDLPLYEPEPPRRQWSGSRKKRLRRTITWVAFGLAVVLVVIAGYVGFNYFSFVGGIHRVGGVVSGQSIGKAQNILLIGNDERPANMTAKQYAQLSTTSDDGSSNTDTMILLHVPADGSSATLISLPRDAYVSIPGHGKGKLNSAYVDGMLSASGTADQKDAAGVKLLIDTIQGITGLTVNHYVKVSLLSFYNIASALGPVSVCLKNPVNDPYSGAHFPAGPQKLNATEALQFVRQRHGLPNGDLDREVRQQYFLSVEAQQVLKAGTLLNPVKLNKVITAVSSSLETDDKLNLLSLATQLKGLKSGGVRSATIPLMPDPYATIDGQSVVQLNYDAIPDFIATVTGQPTSAQRVATAKAASAASVHVDVLNGAGTASGSSTALATYKSLGFQTGSPTDAPAQQQTTTVYFPAGQEAQAKAVLTYLPGAAVAQSSAYKNVTVILGTDGRMPAAHPSSATAPAKKAAAPKTSGSSGSSTPKPSTPTKNYSTTSCID